MIIENGTIELKLKQAGTIDPATGFPSAPQGVEWGSPIPCQYTANRYSNLGRVNGEHFTAASYTILIEERDLDGAEQLRLNDRRGNEVGRFSIIQEERLEAVGQTRLTV